MQATAQEGAGETTGPVSTPTSSIQEDGNSVSQAEPKEQSDTGMILVSKRSIEMLARPSSSAVVMYGFPAGRRFRLIGYESGFAHIQDLKSGATGWIDETTLWQSPDEPAASAPSRPKPSTQKAKNVSLPPKPKPVSHTHKTATASPKSKPKATSKDTETSRPEHPKRHGIFGLPRNRAQGVLF